MCTGGIRVVDAKYYTTVTVRSFTGIDFSLSLSRLHALLDRNSRNGETGGDLFEELGHTTILGLPSVHPNKSKIIVAHCYPLRGSGQRCGR